MEYDKNSKVIVIPEGTVAISDQAFKDFTNLEEVILPDSVESIGVSAFEGCTSLKKINLPENLQAIYPHAFWHTDKLETISLPKHIFYIGNEAFSDPTTILFDELEPIAASNLVFLGFGDRCGYLLLKDGRYFGTMRLSGYGYLPVQPEQIQEITNHDYYINVVGKKKFIFDEIDGEIIVKQIDVEDNTETWVIDTGWNTNILGNNYDLQPYQDFFFKSPAIIYLLYEEMKKQALNLLEQYNIKDSILNKIVEENHVDNTNPLCKDTIEFLARNISPTLEQFIKHNYQNKCLYLPFWFKNNDYLLDYCQLLDQYHRQDGALLKSHFAMSLPTTYQIKLLKYWNPHIKRVLQAFDLDKIPIAMYESIMDKPYFENINKWGSELDARLIPVFNLLETMGAFTFDKKQSQQSCNFIVENLSDKDISCFTYIEPREEYDREFSEFFKKNYQELFTIESNTKHFIESIYNQFRFISKTSSSNRGSQHHLKVTLDKCKSFFLMNDFGKVADNDRVLAEYLGKYYSDIDVLKAAKLIIQETQMAPRNIFTNDNNPQNDIKGLSESGLYYEWLPKQSLDNLILGKLCNCCAHVAGNGAGVMRASMILNNCQNLVIRDENKNIIAKATLHVDKEKGYGVFNVLEISNEYFPVDTSEIDDEQDAYFTNYCDEKLERIYTTFMDGCHHFIEQYNINNPHKPITTLTIGTRKNLLNGEFEKHGHTDTTPLPSLDYSIFAFYNQNEIIGNWHNDHDKGQKLLYKSEKA